MKRGMLTAVAAIFAMLVSVVAGTPASAAVTVSASAPSTYVAGSPAKVTITVSGSFSGTAKLQVKSGSTWSDAARTITVVRGKASTTVQPSVKRTYRIRVGSAHSSEFTVSPVKSSLKVALGSATIAKGTSTKATITLSPSASGKAKLQVKSGSSWTTAARTITISKGKGTTTLAPSVTRTYRIIMGSVVSPAFTVTVAGTASNTSSSLKVSLGSSTISKGASTTATITLSPSASGKAKLQVKSGSSWTTAARTITISKGKGTTSLAPSATRTYRIIMGSVVSPAFTVTVKKPATAPAPALKVTLGSSTITKGSSTTATITLTPSASGSAKLQVKSGSSWTTAARTISISKGKGTTSLAPSVTRTYRIVMGSVVSPAFTVTVGKAPATPSSFTVTGSGWGHGIGMSQYGAYGMALDGYTAAEILTHYFTGTTVATVPASGPIKVQVFGKGADSTTSAVLIVRSPGTGEDANGRWRLNAYTSTGTTPTATWTGTNNDLLKLTRSGSSVTVTRNSGATLSGARLELQWEGTTEYDAASPENPYVEIQTTTGTAATHGHYRHGTIIVSVAGSRLNIVNQLDVNTEYLYGVAEMPSSWAGEALKAQAIAARGYALRSLASGVNAACNCNLYDDTSSQNYSGWKKENEGTDAYYGKRWVAAVDATNGADGLTGQVLHDAKGAIATTYYFSSSGGQTENSEDVWVAAIPYLRAVTDPWSIDPRVKNSNAAWTATITQAKAKAAFGLSDVAAIAVTKRTSDASTAAAYEVTATSTAGKTAKITGTDAIRIALGIKSPWVWTITPQ